jgi:hypothetical protein
MGRLTDVDTLDNERSHVARSAVISTLGPAFRSAGILLWAAGNIFGPDRVKNASPFGNGSDAVVGLAIITQTAGELCAGAASLLNEGNTYAAAALLRQLVEVEYLAWAFAENEEEAAVWLRSTDEDRLRFWQPRHLREKSDGRFRGSDYSLHCKFGGHPTREGARLLPCHTPLPSFSIPLDLAIHGSSIWEYVQSACAKHGYDNLLRSPEVEALNAAMVRWQTRDQMEGV